MSKAVSLAPDALSVPQHLPQAAKGARSFAPLRPSATQQKSGNAPKPIQVPLQVRIPRDDVRAIKVAAAERDQTISDFMLSCFHAFMKSGKK